MTTAITERPLQGRKGWRESGLEPLPWFPFTVAMSAGHTDAAALVGRAAERAYWALARTHRIQPRFTLFVLDRRDWPAWAATPTFGVPHRLGADAIVVGADHDGRGVAAVAAELEILFRERVEQSARAANASPTATSKEY
jgi:hypothetical protein